MASRPRQPLGFLTKEEAAAHVKAGRPVFYAGKAPTAKPRKAPRAPSTVPAGPMPAAREEAVTSAMQSILDRFPGIKAAEIIKRLPPKDRPYGKRILGI